jgi:para-aminobenzoate synthetase component 1
MLNNLPLIKEISYQHPTEVFARFSQQPWAIYLDSAKVIEPFGRYSIIAIDPFSWMTSKNGKVNLNNTIFDANPFDVLQEQLAKYSNHDQSAKVPFLGGAIGYLGYDLCHHVEQLSRPSLDDMNFYDLAIGFYDLIIVYDLQEQQAWIVSNGLPETTSIDRYNKAVARYEKLVEKINQPHTNVSSTSCCSVTDIVSNFTQTQYQQAVQRIIDYIYAGDIFQANLSQRFHCALPDALTSFQLYCRLRCHNPAPFAAYLSLPDVVIASASPERFLKLQAGKIESRPIKGTRKRGQTKEEDQALVLELINSEKDQTENIMIVDLMRNDLSRVCQDHTVRVPQLCELETHTTLHHLVSTVIESDFSWRFNYRSS